MKNTNTTKNKTFDSGDAIQKVLMVIMLFWFIIFLVMPMLMMFGQIFTDDLGNWVDLETLKNILAIHCCFPLLDIRSLSPSLQQPCPP